MAGAKVTGKMGPLGVGLLNVRPRERRRPDRRAVRASKADRSGWFAGFAAAALLLAATGAELDAQSGYTLADNQIIVDAPEHWEAWHLKAGLSYISPDGSISPRFIRKRVNAALDAPRYAVQLEGGVSAGSNEEDAGNIIDGDPTTFWGPDLDRPEQDWWVQLKLGRLVVVEKIVLRFVEEDVGEPFLQFDVLGWRRPPPFSDTKYTLLGTNIAKFWPLYRTDRPIKTQRVFEIEPKTTERHNPAFEGDPLAVIHILVRQSQLDRMREVGPASYAALPEESKGAVDYYRRGGSGRQTLTTKENYETLVPDRQGRVRYFVRERPRLAEVEVWTLGDNLNHDRVAMGGTTELAINSDPGNPATATRTWSLATTVTDGDYSTGASFAIFPHLGNTFVEDLGTQFWVDTMHLLTDGRIDHLGLEVSDGSLAPNGTILWTDVENQAYRADYRAFEMEPRTVRYVRTAFGQRASRSSAGTYAQQVSFLEVMLYGEGYVAEVALMSDVIELGEHKSLVSLEWEADTPAGTWIELSTRTGNSLAAELVYHDSDGQVVTQERYERRLPRQKQGEITRKHLPDGSWSPWSRFYLKSGEEIQSPRIRKYLQIKARVMADTLSKYGDPANLHSIRVNLTDLYADRLWGEVWPCRVHKVGTPEERSFFIRPVFSNDDQSFDEFRVTGTRATTLELVDVRAGTRDDFRGGTYRVIPRLQIDIQRAVADTLIFCLPEPIRPGTELVEVRLNPAVYANSAAFEASVKAAGHSGSWQQVDVGDATDQVDSQTNVVVALADNIMLSDLRIEPPVFTPNGDGVNDVQTFRFSVNRLTAEKSVTVSIFDLSGRRVRQLRAQREDPRGRYALFWSGDGAGGRRVPPGIYLVRLELAAESERAEGTSLSRTVQVVY